MPTGYTVDVKDGKITDFPTFALQCARAFGALIEMRDEPWDAEIPDRFEATRYHDEQLAKARADIDRLEAMTDAERQQAADEAWNQHVADVEAWNAKADLERGRYEGMLKEVRAWEPPTSNHVELKNFMIQQLEESIRFVCKPQTLGARPTPGMWWLDQLEKAKSSIAYHTKEREEAIQRARERTAWVRHLRSSLDQTGVTS